MASDITYIIKNYDVSPDAIEAIEECYNRLIDEIGIHAD